MKSDFIRLFVVAMIIISIVFTSSGIGLAAEPIKLGVVGAHSGDLASYGIPSVRAAELVVKDINTNGGLLGRKIELFVEDDACKPEVNVIRSYGQSVVAKQFKKQHVKISSLQKIR